MFGKLIILTFLIALFGVLILMHLFKSGLYRKVNHWVFKIIGTSVGLSILFLISVSIYKLGEHQTIVKLSKDWVRNKEVTRIVINDVELDSNYVELVMSEISGLKKHRAHHSSPRKKFVFRFISVDGNEHTLVLRNDSYYDNEFWIYNSKGRQIGSIRSDHIRSLLFPNE